jgi:NitT/TauT family transport system substrate-binding protein
MATRGRKRNLIILAVIILVVVIVLSSFVYLNSQKTYTGNVQSIVYGDLTTGSSALIYVAQAQNFFAQNGINFTIQNYASGINTISAAINNQVDIGYATEFGFLANSVLKNENLSIIATVDKFDAYFLVARTDLGITTPSDLNGKSVGVTVGTISQFYLGQFLELNGIDANNVTIVNMPFSQTPEALANRTVDAVVTYSPYTDQIQAQLTSNVVMWSVQSNQEGYGLIFGSDSWISQNPELVIRFLKALNQAENYLINNPSAAESITQKALNRTNAEITELWSQVGWSLSLDQALPLAMQEEAIWLFNNNLTDATSVPNFLNYIYFNGLESVNPNAVTITH